MPILRMQDCKLGFGCSTLKKLLISEHTIAVFSNEAHMEIVLRAVVRLGSASGIYIYHKSSNLFHSSSCT